MILNETSDENGIIQNLNRFFSKQSTTDTSVWHKHTTGELKIEHFK